MKHKIPIEDVQTHVPKKPSARTYVLKFGNKKQITLRVVSLSHRFIFDFDNWDASADTPETRRQATEWARESLCHFAKQTGATAVSWSPDYKIGNLFASPIPEKDGAGIVPMGIIQRNL